MMNQHGKLPKSQQVNPETGDPAKIENWQERILDKQTLDILFTSKILVTQNH